MAARVIGVVGSLFPISSSVELDTVHSAKALVMIASGLKAALTDASHPDDSRLQKPDSSSRLQRRTDSACQTCTRADSTGLNLRHVDQQVRVNITM